MLIENARVFEASGALKPGHGVLVEGGAIRRVAPTAEFEGFAGSRVDGSGGTVVPGLIDCHVHLCYGAEASPSTIAAALTPGQVTMRALDHAQATLRGGTTSVRDCGGIEYLVLAVRDACNAGRQPGPTIRAAGRAICMTGGHGNMFGRVADGVDDVVKAVREQVHAGADVIKMMATGGVMTPGVNPEDAHFSVEELTAGVSEGHRFHKTCASHAQGTQGILNAVTAGFDSVEHGIFMTEEACEALVAAGTYLVPTLSAVENILLHRDVVPAYAVEKCVRVAERHRQSIRMVYEAGGRIAMGTDAGTPFNRHGENARELAYMAGIGMRPADAILAATANAADLLRLADRGRIAEGMAADLLLVDGDPLDDIEAVADPKNHRLVVKDGIVRHGRPTAAAAIAPGLAAI